MSNLALGELETKWERDVYCDVWWDMNESLFKKYHKKYKGDSRNMIAALEEQETLIFMEIWEAAEVEGQRRLGRK